MMIFLLLSLCLCKFSISGNLDAKELSDFQWQIEIDRSPAGFPTGKELEKLNLNNDDEIRLKIIDKLPKESDTQCLFITSKTGQKFACYLPEKPAPKALVSHDSLNPRYVAEIVAAAFYVKGCLEKNAGWWSYEFCRGKQITQFHSAPGKPDYIEYSLGISTGTYRMPEFTHSTKDELLYMEEEYNLGTMCDVVGKLTPRKAIVRYQCDQILSTSEAYIYSVSEVASCEYLIIVRVGSLCRLPQFVAPVDSQEPLGITCHPYVGKEKAFSMAKIINEKKLKKKEGKKLADEMELKLRGVYRRDHTFKRTKINSQEKRNFVINRRMKKDIERFTAEYLKSMHLAKEGEWPSEEKLEAQRLIGKLTQGLVDSDFYDNWQDMDRGHFYFYMMDRNWPKDEYPGALNHVDLLNSYHSRVEKLIHYRMSEYEAELIRQKASLNPNKRENNVVVTPAEITDSLIGYLPGWFPRLKPQQYNHKAADPDFNKQLVDAYYENYLEELSDEFYSENYNKQIMENIVDEVAAFAAIVTMGKEIDGDSVLNSHWSSHLELLKMLIIARQHGELRYESHRVGLLDTRGQPFNPVEISELTKTNKLRDWKTYYDHVKKSSKWSLEKEFHERLQARVRTLLDVAFNDVWSIRKEELIEKWRKKFELFDDLATLMSSLKSNAGGTMAVPFVSGSEDEILQLLTKAGFGDAEMKIQVVSADGSRLDAQSEELKEALNQLVEETIDNLTNRKKAQQREDNYWRMVDDQN